MNASNDADNADFWEMQMELAGSMSEAADKSMKK